MSIIDHTLNKYDILFRTCLDILPLNLVYFVLENGNLCARKVLEMYWKIIFPCLREPCLVHNKLLRLSYVCDSTWTFLKHVISAVCSFHVEDI